MRFLRLFLTVIFAAFGSWGEEWRVVLGGAHETDEAVRLAVDDLREYGARVGLKIELATEAGETANRIMVGDPLRNSATGRMVESGAVKLAPVEDPEGYTISTFNDPGSRTVVVAGGSLIGDVYGLYWIWDRLRVEGRIPDINTTRVPAMKVRLGAAWGRRGVGGSSPEQMRAALRYSFNWVSGPPILDLVPWETEPESETNRQNRDAVRILIEAAHALHMKYFAFANEFTFHPSLLEKAGAELSPCDPKFWDALQAKFRMLLTALPELDGVELCNDDISGFWGRYQPFDVMHDAPECDWSYEKRFSTFVKKVHEVVAGEFGKTYFHFTWGLREHEVHCQPEVFRAIFRDVPVENLYLMPKVTRADRWWHQPYNPTFNLTQHPTVVLFEAMNYYESGASYLFPTFSGDYFQRGLQTFLAPTKSNVRGAAALAGVAQDGWGTLSAYGYVLYRLMWNPNEPIEQIAEDFCAIHFGRGVAAEMAAIYMMSPVAYKYGLHIEPVSYGQFNSLLHMRVGTFPADGYPVVDDGKEHLEFLRKIYLRCAPWRAETLSALNHGLSTAEQMAARYGDIKGRMKDGTVAGEVENRLEMTRNLIRTNIGYVETVLAYFDYEADGLADKRQALAGAHGRLRLARADLEATPNFNYDLFGVDVLMRNADAMLANRASALDRLSRTPGREGIERLIADQQRKYRDLLDAHKDDAVLFGRFKILVDGQDLLIVRGSEYRIENVRWDGAHVEKGEIASPLPRDRVTVVPLDIESRPMHPFVIQQPSEENGYEARIYLDDAPGANGWMIFDLYYIPQPPETLDLGETRVQN